MRWYLRYGLSYPDLEERLAERGIEVDHVTLYRWVQRFTPLLIDVARPCRHVAGSRWFVDETHVKVAGVWSCVYRAVDQHGQVIDVYVSRRRDMASAGTFFTAALTVHGDPGEVIRCGRPRGSRTSLFNETPRTTGRDTCVSTVRASAPFGAGGLMRTLLARSGHGDKSLDCAGGLRSAICSASVHPTRRWVAPVPPRWPSANLCMDQTGEACRFPRKRPAYEPGSSRPDNMR